MMVLFGFIQNGTTGKQIRNVCLIEELFYWFQSCSNSAKNSALQQILKQIMEAHSKYKLGSLGTYWNEYIWWYQFNIKT